MSVNSMMVMGAVRQEEDLITVLRCLVEDISALRERLHRQISMSNPAASSLLSPVLKRMMSVEENMGVVWQFLNARRGSPVRGWTRSAEVLVDAGLLSSEVNSVLSKEKNYFSQVFLKKILNASESCRIAIQHVLLDFQDHAGVSLVPALGHHDEIRDAVVSGASQEPLPVELLKNDLAIRISGGVVEDADEYQLLWKILGGVTGGVLTEMSLRVVPMGQQTVLVVEHEGVVWRTVVASSEELDQGVFLGFLNEILDSVDAFGRLVAAPIFGDLAVGYFTIPESEVLLNKGLLLVDC